MDVYDWMIGFALGLLLHDEDELYEKEWFW